MRLFCVLFIIAFYVGGVSGALAAESPLEMSFKTDKEAMTIGDELTITVEVLHGEEFEFLPPSKDLDLSPFEVKRVEQIPPRHERGVIREGVRLVLTLFELGDFSVPSFTVRLVDPKGETLDLATQEIPVAVRSIGRTDKDTDDIRPIKAPYALPLGLDAGRAFLWILLAALLGVIGFFVAKRFRKKEKVDPESLLPPYERALLRLGRLEKKGYLERHQLKLYFTELSEILERYMIEQLRLGSEDLTTEEVMEIVRQSELSGNLQDAIGDVLKISDLAKFAKWEPPKAESERALAAARRVVEETMPKPEDKVRASEEAAGVTS